MSRFCLFFSFGYTCGIFNANGLRYKDAIDINNKIGWLWFLYNNHSVN